VSKLEGGMQELEETIYWSELLVDAEIVSESRLAELLTEADELMAIFASSAKTAKERLRVKRAGSQSSRSKPAPANVPHDSVA